ncbi:MAG: FAD-dependent oxidoreductase [Pyrinomonadaceae bacterium]
MDDRNIKQIYPSAFPKLDDEQIKAIAEFAECRTYKDGEVLFQAGEREFKFHVVKSGAIEIIDRSGGEPRTLVVQRAREFTGDVANLTGRPANVDAVAREETQVYEVSYEDLRRIINEKPKLSDTILQAFIARWQLLRESDFTGLRVIGSRYSADAFGIRDFLAKNKVLFTWIDVESDPQVEELLKRFSISEADTPVVAYADEWLLRNPSHQELAECIGIKPSLSEDVYDLAIVGAGPAGLAAAVYGSSEGLKTVVLEGVAPGGQAGTSTRIENYLGFPLGVSGEELAGRAFMQAQKFGAQLSTPSQVVKLEFGGAYPVLHLDDGGHISAKCVLIATGAEYRKLDVEGRERFDGTGVYYAAGKIEAQTCSGAQVVVVGGGNSAGQAVVFLAGFARKVLLLIRGDDLGKNMSRYLAQRIEHTPNAELLINSQITR